MLGQFHLDGCDVEECPRCFGQLLGCGCEQGKGPAPSQLESRDLVEARHAEMFRRIDEERLLQEIADPTIRTSFDK
jgi:hypothetical protein